MLFGDCSGCGNRYGNRVVTVAIATTTPIWMVVAANIFAMKKNALAMTFATGMIVISVAVQWLHLHVYGIGYNHRYGKLSGYGNMVNAAAAHNDNSHGNLAIVMAMAMPLGTIFYPAHIAWDAVAGKVYWADSGLDHR